MIIIIKEFNTSILKFTLRYTVKIIGSIHYSDTDSVALEPFLNDFTRSFLVQVLLLTVFHE
jgi:hypothetical protein